MLIKIYNVGSTVVAKHMASIFRVQDRGSMWVPIYQTTYWHNPEAQIYDNNRSVKYMYGHDQ